MAPTVPKKRTSLRAKASKSTSEVYTPPARREGASLSDGFLESKKDKRLIKHSSFINRIEKGHKKPLKRRRPNKKLITTLEGLADALPDTESLEELGRGGRGDEGEKMKLKSLRHRPGALKRKERLERMERERFGKNMAQLNAGVTTSPVPVEGTAVGVEQTQNSTGSRWAALRGFISSTLEQKDEFMMK